MFKRAFLALTLATMAAVGFLASIATTAAHHIAVVARDIFLGPLPMDQTAGESALASRPLVAARSFVLRVLKRERPVITNDWRMCPST